MRQIATLSPPEYWSATGREQSGYPLETHQISIETGTTPAPEGYDFNPPSRNAGGSLGCRPNLTPFESGCWPNARGCWRKGADRPTSGRGDGLGTPGDGSPAGVVAPRWPSRRHPAPQPRPSPAIETVLHRPWSAGPVPRRVPRRVPRQYLSCWRPGTFLTSRPWWLYQYRRPCARARDDIDINMTQA